MLDLFSKYFLNSKRYPFHFGNRKDLIFIHITKTAGTSIHNALGFNKIEQGNDIQKHYHAKEIIKVVGEEQWTKAFKFTFVRNPWDRLFSYYRFRRNIRLSKGKKFGEFSHDNFRKWAFGLILDRYENIKEKRKIMLGPQLDWLTDEDDKLNIEFIGRYETIQTDFKKVCSLTGLKGDLEHLNQSHPICHYTDFYEKDLIDIVAEFYRKDLEAFNYSFS